MLKKNLLIIIPARSNSKTIKNKNLLKVFGKHLIYYSIKIAKKIRDNKKIIFCSTDSKQIKNIAEGYGIHVPFIRPKKIALDLSRDIDFVNHALSEFNKKKLFLNIVLFCALLLPLEISKIYTMLINCCKVIKNQAP